MWLISLCKLDDGCDTAVTGSDIYAANTANTVGTNVYASCRSGLYTAASARLYATTIAAKTQADSATRTIRAADTTRFACGSQAYGNVCSCSEAEYAA